MSLLDTLLPPKFMEQVEAFLGEGKTRLDKIEAQMMRLETKLDIIIAALPEEEEHGR